MIKFSLNHPYAQLPSYKTEGAAGFDLSSVEDVVIQPGEVKMIPTGLTCEFPDHLELQIRSRSSMGIRGVIMPNGIGTVDSDYRGELVVPLMNLSDDVVFIDTGERVAQGVLSPVCREEIEVADNDQLSATTRGAGGFGSTGRH